MAKQSRQQIDENKQRTMELLAQYRAKPSKRLRDRIFELNLPLAHREANSFLKTVDAELDDLCQVASEGLIKAIERFDLSKGHAFSSYACRVVKGELLHYRRDRCTSGGLKVSRTWKEQAGKLERLAAEGRSAQFISEQTGIAVEDVPTAIAATSSRKVSSLDARFSEDGEAVGFEIPTWDSESSHWCRVAEAMGVPIQRRADGLINATLICKSTGKQFWRYWELRQAKKYLQNLSKTSSRARFFEIRRGRTGGAWLNDQLAIELIRWCDPKIGMAIDMFTAASVIESA